ncbi:MAG TPA: LppP/LprE family lipoprotein [Solirubrobacteraceae bacterium]|nr:LppP/LprE family lipoprotein [Solirubrobacteraceae bacterium]
MAAHAMHYPRRRRRRWPRRILGVLATLAFLGSGAAIAYMVIPQEEEPTPAPVQQDAAVKGATNAKPALTRAQKRARRDAVAQLAQEGYEPVRLADWRPKAPLKVLVGRSDTDAMRAFFFADGEFIGYDDKTTSNHLRVVKAGGNAVTLAYKLSDGTTAKIRFEYADGTLTPSEPVPARTLR